MKQEASQEEIEAVKKQLAETMNNPNMLIVCGFGIFCSICKNPWGECSCNPPPA